VATPERAGEETPKKKENRGKTELYPPQGRLPPGPGSRKTQNYHRGKETKQEATWGERQEQRQKKQEVTTIQGGNAHKRDYERNKRKNGEGSLSHRKGRLGGKVKRKFTFANSNLDKCKSNKINLLKKKKTKCQRLGQREPRKHQGKIMAHQIPSWGKGASHDQTQYLSRYIHAGSGTAARRRGQEHKTKEKTNS